MGPHPEIRRYLIDKASKEQVVHYQQLCNDVGLKLNMADNPHDRLIIGGILGEISSYENENERPLLSSIVVSKSGFEQGDGFFKLAEELGFGEWRKLKGHGTFEIEMMKKTFEFWKDKTNYKKYRT